MGGLGVLDWVREDVSGWKAWVLVNGWVGWVWVVTLGVDG